MVFFLKPTAKRETVPLIFCSDQIVCNGSLIFMDVVTKKVEIAEETRAALRQAWGEGNGGVGEDFAAPTPATMAIPTWDTYTPMVHVEGCEGGASWARTPDAGEFILSLICTGCPIYVVF